MMKIFSEICTTLYVKTLAAPRKNGTIEKASKPSAKLNSENILSNLKERDNLQELIADFQRKFRE